VRAPLRDAGAAVPAADADAAALAAATALMPPDPEQRTQALELWLALQLSPTVRLAALNFLRLLKLTGFAKVRIVYIINDVLKIPKRSRSRKIIQDLSFFTIGRIRNSPYPKAISKIRTLHRINFINPHIRVIFL
jgi:hypothetical protein